MFCQLQMLRAFFVSFSDEHGMLVGWWDRFLKTAYIHLDTLNLYQLVDWIIFPATAPFKCSFVEWIATQQTQPTK